MNDKTKPARKAPLKMSSTAGNLAHCLQKVAGTAQNSAVLEIMRNVLVDVKDGQARLTAVNQDMQVTAFCEVEHEQPFKMTLPAQKLGEILRQLPAEEVVNITWEKGKSRAVLASKDSSFRLATLSVDDFPLMGKFGAVRAKKKLPARELLSVLKRVQYASASQSHRICLNGVLMEVEDKGLILVATDGHRMAIEEVAAEGEIIAPKKGKDDESARQFILPRKSVQELARNLDVDEDIDIEVAAQSAKFSALSFTLISNLIDESYPDYRSVIPRNNDKKVKVERRPFLETINRVMAICESGTTLLFNIRKGEIELETENKDNDTAKDVFPVVFDGEEAKIGFNGSFLKDMLGATEDDVVEMSFLNPSDSVLFKPSDEARTFKYIVMPVRL